MSRVVPLTVRLRILSNKPYPGSDLKTIDVDSPWHMKKFFIYLLYRRRAHLFSAPVTCLFQRPAEIRKILSIPIWTKLERETLDGCVFGANRDPHTAVRLHLLDRTLQWILIQLTCLNHSIWRSNGVWWPNGNLRISRKCERIREARPPHEPWFIYNSSTSISLILMRRSDPDLRFVWPRSNS